MAAKLATLTLAVSTGTGTDNVVGSTVGGFHDYDYFMVDGVLTNTGSGAVDVCVQRRVGNSTLWRDWIHFPQLAAAAGAKLYTVTPQASNAIVAVGSGSDITLAANTTVGGHPGGALRLVANQSGAGVHISQTQTVYVTCWKDRHG